VFERIEHYTEANLFPYYDIIQNTILDYMNCLTYEIIVYYEQPMRNVI